MTALIPLFNPAAIRERIVLALKAQLPDLHVMHQHEQGINNPVHLRTQRDYMKQYVSEQTYVTTETDTADSLIEQFVSAILYTLEQQEAADGRIVFTWREMAAQSDAKEGKYCMSYYAMTYGIARATFK